MILNPKIEIKESPIEGKGLFARAKFKKGEEVWVAKDAKHNPGKIMTSAEFEKFKQQCIRESKEWDSVSIGGGKVRAAVANRDEVPGNYGNHSCDPNTDVIDGKLTTIRDIKRGEEITIDYAQFSDKSWSMKCNCGSPNCRGIVHGTVE